MSQKNIFFFLFLLCISPSALSAKPLLLVSLESPPAEYMQDGQPTGRNVEIVQEALKRMGIESTILLVPWKRALKMVESGDADGIIDVAYNTERAAYLHYPQEPLYVEEWYGYALKDSNITLDKDLHNAGEIRLGTSRGFEYGGLIQEAIDNKRFQSIEEVHNNELNIEKLISKRFHMFIGVKLTISYYAKKTGYRDKIEAVKMTGTDEHYLLNMSDTYLGFSQKTMTKKMVNTFSKTLVKMKQDGTVERIEKKYY